MGRRSLWSLAAVAVVLMLLAVPPVGADDDDDEDMADLRAVELDVPEDMEAGDRIAAQVRLANRGDDGSGRFRFSILLSSDRHLGDDVTLYESGPVSLGEGAVMGRIVYLDIPDRAGDIYLLLHADCRDEVRESDEGNNLLAEGPFTLGTASLDLAADGLELEGERVTYAVSNRGDTGPDTFTVALLLSDDAFPSNDDDVLLERTMDLPPGSSTEGDATLDVGRSGHIILWVDPWDEVAEDDESNNVAEVRYHHPSIDVTYPNGGEIWEEGSEQTITWSSDGDIGTVRIELLLDMERELTIATSVPDSGSYSWTPSLSADGLSIRVSDTDGTAADVSDGTFSVVPELYQGEGGVRILSATLNGEAASELEVAAGSRVTGTLSVHVASHWTTAAPLAATVDWGEAGTSFWGVSPSVRYGERVLEVPVDVTVPDEPGIHHIIVAMAPVSTYAQVMSATSLPEAVWGDGNDIGEWGTGTIEDAMADGRAEADWLTAEGMVMMTVPADAVRLVVGEPPSLTLLSPDGGEEWEQGTVQTILWESTGELEDVRLDLLRDGVHRSVISSTTPDDGHYEWVVPLSLEAGGGYTVRVKEPADTHVYDHSDGEFSVTVARTIEVTSPGGGEVWRPGTEHVIAWNSTGAVDMVDILLRPPAGNDVPLASSVPDDGRFRWTLPEDIGAGHYRAVVMASDSSSVVGVSGLFTVPSPSHEEWITVLSPNGGEELIVGDEVEIIWDSSDGGGVVTIQLYRDGRYHSAIISPTDNDGRYLWTVPDEQGDDLMVSIYAYSNSSVSDLSDAAFSIVPAPSAPTIAITCPSSAEEWARGSLQRVTWTTTGDVPLVRIDVLHGEEAMTVAESTPNDGHFLLPVPELEGVFRLRIASVSDPAVSALSPELVNAAPVGGGIDMEGLSGLTLTLLTATTGLILLAVVRYHFIRRP